jgi:putative tricarboxylic transport membrane protein
MKRLHRRSVLRILAAGTSAGLVARPAILRAATYPSRGITIINPYPPGGYVDNIARAVTSPLSQKFNQPVTVIDTPGANGMLGHEYFLAQPSDGYTILADGVTFVYLNILLQHAPFKVTDFSMINLPARDYTLLATAAANAKLKTLNDVISRLRHDSTSLSIGVQRSSSDYVNLVLMLRAAGIKTDNLRLVTFDGGGPTRTAVLGGVVDIGLTGAEGFLPIAEQVRPLLIFASQRIPPFDAPAVTEVELGAPIDFVAGTLRGFAVSTRFKMQFPDRYATVVQAFKDVFTNPSVVKSLNAAQLASTWYGPEASQDVYLKTFEQMKQNVSLLQPT